MHLSHGSHQTTQTNILLSYLYWLRCRHDTPVGVMPASRGRWTGVPWGSRADQLELPRPPTTDARTGTGTAPRSTGHVTCPPRTASLPSRRPLAAECWRRCVVDRWRFVVAETVSASSPRTSLPASPPRRLSAAASSWRQPTSERTSTTTLTAGDWSWTEDPSYWWTRLQTGHLDTGHHSSTCTSL